MRPAACALRVVCSKIDLANGARMPTLRSFSLSLFGAALCAASLPAQTWHVHPTTGRQYLLTKQDFDWEGAERYARSLGGHLVRFDSVAEWTWVTGQFFPLRSNASSFPHPWTGLRRDPKITPWKWVWSDGTPLSQPTFWGSSEPSNSGGNETAVHIWVKRALVNSQWAIVSDWNDTRADTKRPALVELEPGVRDAVYNPDTRKFYAIVRNVTWAEARAFAARVGGHLVIFDTPREQAWVTQNLTSAQGWIGLRRAASTKPWTWEWVSGLPLTRTHCATACGNGPPPWGPGEPNNRGGIESSGELMQNGRWNDLNPLARRNAILELPASYRYVAEGCDRLSGVLRGELPRVGRRFSLALTVLPPRAPYIVYFGLQRIDPPLRLDAVGMTGCRLHVGGILAHFVGVADARGRSVFTMPLPANTGLVGLQFYNQAAYLDASANPRGFGWSNAGHGIIGR